MIIGQESSLGNKYIKVCSSPGYPLEQTVHIVLDGAVYHRTEMVKNAAKVLNIELHYLPPYSPNLNPIEQLWKVMNEHVRNNVYFPSTPDFW